MKEKTLVYTGAVINGQLAIAERERMRADFKEAGNCDSAKIIIKLGGDEKTAPQMRAFYGAIIEQVSAFEMDVNGVFKSNDRIKDELKRAFLPLRKRYWSDGSPVIIKIAHPEKKGVTVDWHVEEVPSLADLSMDEMRAFFDAIISHYQERGLIIEIGHDSGFPAVER